MEPGGRGYYLWKIGQAIHGTYPKGHAQEIKNQPPFGPTELLTPDQWKEMLFEDIFKQQLKGSEVEYNSDSLEAINVFEE